MAVLQFVCSSPVCFFLNFSGEKNGQYTFKHQHQQIQDYLVHARNDDPKVFVLKKKLIKLKNAWAGEAAHAVPMVPRIVQAEQHSLPDADMKEFERLLTKDNQSHQQKTVAILNKMFSDSSKILFAGKKNALAKIRLSTANSCKR